MPDLKLLVTGANGFIGRAVCELFGGTPRGLARRGAPSPLPDGLKGVEWFTGSVFDADILAKAVTGVSAVVHCVGILREHGKDTFKKVNGDAAIAVGEAARAAGAHTFVFLSAAEKPPLVHEEYLSSKRRAEVALVKTGMRVVIMRPGLVYGAERPLSVLAARLLKAARAVSGSTLLRANAPIRVRMLAKAIVVALHDSSVHGVIEVPRMRELAQAYPSPTP